MNAAAIARTTFVTSRLLEFASERELVTQTGTRPDDWLLMIIREIVDNGLDACEEHGVAPVIHVTVANGKIRVRDNGPGLPPETVASILDFTTRTSSREAYQAPDRGRQGNAAKVIVAIPFALDGNRGRVEIEARGVHHDIRFAVDRIAQAPVIEHVQTRRSVKSGTSITVHWPESARSKLDDSSAEFLPDTPISTRTCRSARPGSTTTEARAGAGRRSIPDGRSGRPRRRLARTGMARQSSNGWPPPSSRTTGRMAAPACCATSSPNSTGCQGLENGSASWTTSVCNEHRSTGCS
jgi:Histidine kinase-, DNA gyrase B-, and HSP90-like ATPase